MHPTQNVVITNMTYWFSSGESATEVQDVTDGTADLELTVQTWVPAGGKEPLSRNHARSTAAAVERRLVRLSHDGQLMWCRRQPEELHGCRRAADLLRRQRGSF
jgi:hypothetical protein